MPAFLCLRLEISLKYRIRVNAKMLNRRPPRCQCNGQPAGRNQTLPCKIEIPNALRLSGVVDVRRPLGHKGHPGPLK